MRQQIDPESLDAALYMALDYLPATPEARSLSAAFAALAFAANTRRKKGRRGKRQADFEQAAGAMAADLLIAGEMPGRYSYRSKHKGSFTGERVGFAAFMQLIEGSQAAGLIEAHETKWSYNRIDWGDGVVSGHGKAQRLRATARFFELALAHGITPSNIKEHFERFPNEFDLLVLKSSKERVGGRKRGGDRMRFDETETTHRLRQEIEELNRFLSQQEIRGGVHVGYYRVFNQGDRVPYHWNKGGRLTSVGDETYQNLGKPLRLQMTINGEPVVEIDVRASQLTILHALKGVPFDTSPDADPYNIPALYRDGMPRDVSRTIAKRFVTMTLGHTRFHTRWPADKVTEFRDKHGIELGKVFPLKEVQAAVIARLPVMANWPDPSVTCFDLMFFESQAIIGSMLALKREHGIPSLGVHDSLIVPASAEALAAITLRTSYFAACDADPYLDIRRPTLPAPAMTAASLSEPYPPSPPDFHPHSLDQGRDEEVGREGGGGGLEH